LDALELHRQTTVVDAHHDLLMLVAFEHAKGNTDTFRNRWIPEMREGGIDVQILPVFVSEESPESVLRKALQMVDALHVEVEKNPDDVKLCLTRSDLDYALDKNKIALVLALEGAEAIRGELSVLRILHRLGLRMMSLTWNNRTMLADGNEENSTGGRLTSIGVAAVSEMERLGIILDVSHLSDAGFWHVSEIATRPFVATHSNSRALFDHSRGLTDEQIKAVAASGGVVGINLHPMLLGGDGASIEDALDHLERVLEVAGEDHVGLGPDFCAELEELGPMLDPPTASGLKDLERSPDLPSFTEAIIGRGIPEEVAKKILGANFLRVLRQGLPA
jgi:membrane dipeptidase